MGKMKNKITIYKRIFKSHLFKVFQGKSDFGIHFGNF